MSLVTSNFEKVKKEINYDVNIIAVSKSFNYDHVEPLIKFGHKHFGENKVQEALSKWSFIKNSKTDIKLHMIGKLQSNKAREAVKLFDYIHSLDNLKLAQTLSKSENLLNLKRKYFIQVNIGEEKQKSGVFKQQLIFFYNHCVVDLNLNVIGLMCIPPVDKNPSFYFNETMQLNRSLGLKDLSMGMSADFKEALKYNSTFVRIGSAIFGKRN